MGVEEREREAVAMVEVLRGPVVSQTPDLVPGALAALAGAGKVARAAEMGADRDDPILELLPGAAVVLRGQAGNLISKIKHSEFLCVYLQICISQASHFPVLRDLLSK